MNEIRLTLRLNCFVSNKNLKLRNASQNDSNKGLTVVSPEKIYRNQRFE